MPSSIHPVVRPVSLVVQLSEKLPERYSRFSSFDHMIQIVAWMRRFVNRGRRQQTNDTSILTLTELEDAQRLLLLESQSRYFASLLDELARSDWLDYAL